MKKSFLFTVCFSLFIFSSSLSYGQSWMWGRDGSGTIKNLISIYSVASDNEGNLYGAGWFPTDLTFGTDTLTCKGFSAFLVKYDKAGNVIWARQPTDTSNCDGYSVATDHKGNIYETGGFGGTAIFGKDTLTNTRDNYFDVFLVKYNTNGNVLWAKQSEIPSAFSGGYGIWVATDKFGNIFVTGKFNDTISFGSYILHSTQTSYNSNVFLVKYDSNGNVLWARQSETPSAGCVADVNTVCADNSGNAYITGYFQDTLSFGTTSLSGFSSFLVKYSSAGDIEWAENINSSTKGTVSSSSVITDRAGSSYVTGYFTDTVSFGPYNCYAPDEYCMFLTKYDTNGHVAWAKQSSQGWEGDALARDASDHIYIAGSLSGGGSGVPDTMKFGNFALIDDSIAFATASFILRTDTSGIAVCGSILNGLGGNENTSPTSVASDSTGTYIYTASSCQTTIYCGSDTVIPQQDADIFFGRWQNCAEDAGMNPIQSSRPPITLYPNPSNGAFTIESPVVLGQSSIKIYNVLGEKVYSKFLTLNSQFVIDLSSQPSGIYLYRVVQEDGSLIGEGKIIVQK